LVVFKKVVKQNHNGGRRRKDYSIRMDVAKRIAMTERSEKGNRIKEYFIACEEKLNEIRLLAAKFPNPADYARAWADEYEKKQKEIEVKNE
jgi:anti-repressor protein